MSTSQADCVTAFSYGTSTNPNTTTPTSHTVLLTRLSSTTAYHFRVKSKNICGKLADSPDLTISSFNTPPRSIRSSAATPTLASQHDTSAVEIGVEFHSDVSSYIIGLRFYEAVRTQVRTWATRGKLLAHFLASATFTNQTTTCSQQVNFAAPMAITAIIPHVASYHTNVGGYADNVSYFATTGVDNAPLHAPANGAVSGENGAYLYGAGGFPMQTFSARNYWVDIIFVPR